MPASAPAFNIGQVVYLRESAALGRLEAMRISGIHMATDEWIYTITLDGPAQRSTATFGDRVSLITGAILTYTESEFVLLCDALALAEANAQRALDKVQAQRAALCPRGTE